MPTIDALLRQVPLNVRETVRETVDRTRQAVRDALRAECRLVMNSNADDGDERGARAQVPTHVVDAMPDGITGVEVSEDAAQLLALAPQAHALRAMVNGIPDLLVLNERLREHPGRKVAPIGNPASLVEVRDWARDMLAALDKGNPIKDILNFNTDVLGCYRFRANETDETATNSASVLLYWMPIGLVARSAGITVEDLTIVVLAHELAHAFTQLGADIDGRRWPSAAFAEAKPALVEALAQYYAGRCLARLRNRYPGAEDAFERLLDLQPTIYSGHEDFAHAVSPEAVRWAMLEVRMARHTTLDEFRECLRRAVDQYPGRPERPTAREMRRY